MSIIPGIENFAPERTETRSGSSGSPSVSPIVVLERGEVLPGLLEHPGGAPPWARKVRQASVVIVNPGGTGSPMVVISARLAPLPPRRSFMSLLPSEKS